jgi:RNA polymerase sigma-70 factor, ECF subfamily
MPFTTDTCEMAARTDIAGKDCLRARLFVSITRENPVNTETPADVTRDLQAWGAGDSRAADRLMPAVYQQLRGMAADYFRRERADHTLQPTALVHEAYLRLVDQERVTWKNRAHFRAVAAQLMRRVLLEHARSHNAEKRGGKLEKIYLGDTRELSATRTPDLLELDEALRAFADTYPREGGVVEMKFFGGLEAKEIAEVLQVSEKTVLRDWSFAKMWLQRELS